ncbi:MAG: hypothetical protein JSW35_10295 [Deltaproteobacteria bacterium]|nr:MAG: hypothetical protein JSW35_10295 [Deltaproteobacteria bacterium]
MMEAFGLDCSFGWVLTNLSVNPTAAFAGDISLNRIIRILVEVILRDGTWEFEQSN